MAGRFWGCTEFRWAVVVSVVNHGKYRDRSFRCGSVTTVFSSYPSNLVQSLLILEWITCQANRVYEGHETMEIFLVEYLANYGKKFTQKRGFWGKKEKMCFRYSLDRHIRFKIHPSHINCEETKKSQHLLVSVPFFLFFPFLFGGLVWFNCCEMLIWCCGERFNSVFEILTMTKAWKIRLHSSEFYFIFLVIDINEQLEFKSAFS